MSAPRLSERLREGTRVLHAQAERSGVMRALLRGELDRAGYARLLRNLHPIYAALEAALERHATHPAIEPLHDPALARRAALEADLGALAGTDWAQALAPAPAGAEYAARLAHCADADPPLLVAHAYVRYLGDLSGGQILHGIVRDSLRLGAGPGDAFYRYAGHDAAALAARFRAGLDAIALDAPGAEALVREAQAGFALHVRLFEQLAPAAAR